MKTLYTLALAGLLGGLMSASLIQAQQPAPAQPTEQELAAQQKEFEAKIESFGWTRQGSAQIGSMAQVSIPQGWRFTPGSGAREMLKLSGNLTSDRELGLLTTEGADGPWVIFEFDESGYVKDDEKNDLKADEALKSYQDGQEASNERRKEMGLRPLHVLGWALPPRFNDKTKNLEWALRIGSEGGESINYSTRLLGRNGVMEVGLVCGPQELQTLLPQYQSIMAAFQYLPGNTYAEYRSGDKVAKYGLTALVAGGAAVAAGKMGLFAKLGGLFAKLGKGVIVVVIGIGAAIKSALTKFFGHKNT